MSGLFLIVGSIFVFVAALIHLLIFFMESVLWSKPAIWKRFGVKSEDDAATLRPMAFNQGFYNVFLAVGAGVGLILIGTQNFHQAGIALSIFALLSMLLAAVVLIVSNPKLARAAAIQGVAPLLGLVSLSIALTQS